MNCLQCGKTAVESGEEYKGIKIRECEDGHRTAICAEAYKRKLPAKINKHRVQKTTSISASIIHLFLIMFKFHFYVTIVIWYSVIQIKHKADLIAIV